MANENRTIYTGVTGNLRRRVSQHKAREAGFTARYGLTRLVYMKHFDNPWDAIAYEKRLKGWARAKKVALIEADNPHWDDLWGGVTNTWC